MRNETAPKVQIPHIHSLRHVYRATERKRKIKNEKGRDRGRFTDPIHIDEHKERRMTRTRPVAHFVLNLMI